MDKKRTIFLIFSVALAVLLLFDIILLCCVATMEEKPQMPTGGVVLDPNATDEREEQGSGASSSVTVAGFSALTIPPEIAIVPIDLHNPIENNGLFYMTFELRLPDESEQGYEVLFKMGYVAPGQHIYQVELSRGLPAGSYMTKLLIQPYRMSDLSPTNNVVADVKLTVK